MKPALFYSMTNEELLEAIFDAMAEARQRHITHAANCAAFGIPPEETAEIEEAAVREEIEKIKRRQAEQAQKKARKEAEENQRREKQIRNWTKKRELALLIQEALGEGWKINVWNNSDKRIYIDGPGRKKVSYFCEGNSWNAPGTIKVEGMGRLPKKQKSALIEACRKADKDWRSTQFEVDEAAAWQPPRPLGIGEHDIEIEVA